MQAVQSAPESPAISPDWNTIQSLYLQGKTPKQIEAETGVKAQSVSVRANRKGWTASLAKAKLIVRVTQDEGKAESDSESKSQAKSERVRAGLASILERSVDKLASMPIPTHKVALRVNGELESVVRNAKTVFGWTENAQAPAIRIGVLAQVTIQPASAPTIEPELSQECSRNPPIDAQVVDVQQKEVGS